MESSLKTVTWWFVNSYRECMDCGDVRNAGTRCPNGACKSPNFFTCKVKTPMYLMQTTRFK